MKINLLILSQNERLMHQLEKYVENDKDENVREFLSKYFPSKNINFFHTRIIMELGDTLVGMKYEPDVKEYLNEIRESTRNMILRYHKRKKEVQNAMCNIKYQNDVNYLSLTHEQRMSLDYSEETIDNMLHQLDARDDYYNYSEGYEFEHYQAYSWLINQIDKALNNHVHESRPLLKDLLDI